MGYVAEEYWPRRFEEQGESYVARGGRQDSHDRQLEALTPYLSHLPNNGRVLDYGCGPERFRGALEDRDLEYEGVDLIPYLGTMEVDEIASESFDCAVAIFVLQHIVDFDRYVDAIETVHRALKPSGSFFVVDHDEDPDTYEGEHMDPRGPQGVLAIKGWSGWNPIGTYDGHWIAKFVK